MDSIELEITDFAYGGAGIGRDDLSEVTYFGPDYHPHIKKYRLNANAENQTRWIRELKENLKS